MAAKDRERLLRDVERLLGTRGVVQTGELNYDPRGTGIRITAPGRSAIEVATIGDDDYLVLLASSAAFSSDDVVARRGEDRGELAADFVLDTIADVLSFGALEFVSPKIAVLLRGNDWAAVRQAHTIVEPRREWAAWNGLAES